jgi:anaphase-promoting complex subunit 3
LSNQSKNNYLNQYNQQQSQQPIISAQFSSRKKSSPKYQILVEQSVCLENMMNLLRDIGMAFYNLKQYECEKALGYFELLPQSQIQSSFVLSHMARAHFELHNYLKAEKIYVQLRREYPYHLEGMSFRFLTCVINDKH